MAQISTVAIPAYTIPKTLTSRQGRSITMDFSPTQLTANVTSGDNILIATLRKDARILDVGVRLVGIAGTAGAFVTLRTTENSVSSNLTAGLNVTTSGSISMGFASPIVDNRYVKTLELLVGGGSIDSTATGLVEVTVHYDFFKMSG